ncbi:MAG: FkbM family methyltransferase [Methylococcaceae bacterium]|nr:FkbM family methyltransferase [Methylococcaceae bacterium]
MNIFKKYMTITFPKVAKSYLNYINNRSTRLLGIKETALGFKFSGNKFMQDGTFEPEETKLLSELLINSEVFVDIGANIGFYCCLAKLLNNHVIAFEPDSDNLQVLYSNLVANGWCDVEVFPMGLAEAPRIAELYGFGTGASLIPNWAGVPSTLNNSIALSTLDIALSKRFSNKKILIKIDVEGAELAVLKGSLDLLEFHPNLTFLIEICLTEHHPQGVNPNFYNVFELFDCYGYVARTVEQESKVVTLSVAKEWSTTGIRTYGHRNFLFQKGS